MKRLIYLFFVFGSVVGFAKHFADDNPVWVVFTKSEQVKDLLFPQTKILFNVLAPLNEIGNTFVHQRVNYLILADTAENSLFLIAKLTRLVNHNTKQKHLLVLETKIDQATMEEIFKALWRVSVYNVAIVSDDVVSTWYPFGKKSNCGNKIVTKLTKQAFDGKIPKTFTKCVVKVTWKNYLFLSTGPNAEMLGAINQMLLLIAEKIGLTMDFEAKENHLVYEEHFNRTPTALLSKYVLENQIDVISNLYGPSIALFIDNRLEMSIPLSIYEDLWLLPQKKPKPIVEAFVSALTLQEYLLIAATFLLFTFIWSFASKNLFNVVRIFLQQPTSNVQTTSNKLLLVFGLFFTIHIGYFYSSQLLRVLYRPVYPVSYKTVEEVLQKSDLKFNYPVYASEIQRNRNELLWREMEKRKSDVVVGSIYPSWESRKQQFLGLNEVLRISNYDLYYVHNPQDLEILEEQVGKFYKYLQSCVNPGVVISQFALWPVKKVFAADQISTKTCKLRGK